MLVMPYLLLMIQNVPVVTLSKEDNKDFIEQQNKGLERIKNKRTK